MYDSGFWDDIKDVAKGALIVASIFPPTAPVVVPMTVAVRTTGLATNYKKTIKERFNARQVKPYCLEFPRELTKKEVGKISK